MTKIITGVLAAALLSAVITQSAIAQVNPFGRSGVELTAEDLQMLKSAGSKLYEGETAEVGTVESWSNPQSGNSGTIKLIDLTEYKGMPCRRLQHDIAIKNVADPFRYVVDRCQTPSGEWKSR